MSKIKTNVKDWFLVTASELKANGIIVIVAVAVALALLSLISLFVPRDIQDNVWKQMKTFNFASSKEFKGVPEEIAKSINENIGELATKSKTYSEFMGVLKDFDNPWWNNFGAPVPETIKELIVTGVSGWHDDAVQGSSLAEILRTVGQGSTYAIIAALIISLRDKASLDRNRTQYILFNKQLVTSSKLIAGVIRFLLPTLIVIVFSPILVIYNKNGEFSSTVDVFSKTISFMVSMLFFFGLTLVVALWINSLELRKKIKFSLLATWLLMSVGINLVFGIVTPLVDEVEDFMSSNPYVVSFVPVLNFTTSYSILSNEIPVWTMAAPIVEYTIFLAIFWTKFSTSLKRHLCV